MTPLPKIATVVFTALASSLVGPAVPTSAKPKTIQGTISRFECGDNCYLIIVDQAKQEQTGLCLAQQCEEWNAKAAMPKRFIGKRVTVTLGTGQQFDNDGNAMGDFMSFTSIRFLK